MANNRRSTRIKGKAHGPLGKVEFQNNDSEAYRLEKAKLKNADRANKRQNQTERTRIRNEQRIKTKGARTASRVGSAAVNQAGRSMRDDENWLSKTTAIASTIDPSTVTTESGGKGADNSTANKIGEVADSVGGSYGLW